MQIQYLRQAALEDGLVDAVAHEEGLKGQENCEEAYVLKELA